MEYAVVSDQFLLKNYHPGKDVFKNTFHFNYYNFKMYLCGYG